MMIAMTSGGGLLLLSIVIITSLLHVTVVFGGIGVLTVQAAAVSCFVAATTPAGWVLTRTRRTTPPPRPTWLDQQQQHTVKCWAKPPPRSSFDLDAIEAFETQLDRQQQQQEEEETKARNRNIVSPYSIDDDDDLLEEEEENETQEEAIVVTIPEHLSGKRIDAALTDLLQQEKQQQQQGQLLGENLSRSFIGNLLSEECIHLISSASGDENVKALVDRKSFQVQAGQVFEISLSSFRASRAPTEIVAQDLALDILYEDEHVIVLNKAAHMVVHPAAGNWDGTVVNALQFYLTHRSPFGSGEFVVNNKEKPNTSSSNDNSSTLTNDDSQLSSSLQHFRPGIVHRLDKGTTGVLIVAKTQSALAKLSSDFAARYNVKKTYLAITVGNPGKRVVIDKPIARHPLHRQKMRVVPSHDNNDDDNNAPYNKSNRRGRNSNNNARGGDNDARALKPGRRALSMVDTIAFDGKLSLVQVAIQTGRTHQIRVHLQDRHTPIYGDDVYGLTDWNKKLATQHGIVNRPLLHAYRLEVDHPVTGEKMYFQAPLPDDMLRIAKAIYPRSSDTESAEDDRDDDGNEEKIFPHVYTQRAAGKREILE